MKILKVLSAVLPDVKILQFQRFSDERGYFTEHFRKAELLQNSKLPFLQGVEIVQANESFSQRGVVRGLHFQWNPVMGKLVRVIAGSMLDAFLDIRMHSPTFGKIALHKLTANSQAGVSEWIWLPPGFAHGCCFLAPTYIEYFCSGTYSPQCEAGISPLALDLDWSLCKPSLRRQFQDIVSETKLITEKDRQGFSLAAWQKQPQAQNFV